MFCCAIASGGPYRLNTAGSQQMFSRLARPLQHQHTLFNWGDTNSQYAKEGGSFEECDAAKKEGPSKSVMLLSQGRM